MQSLPRKILPPIAAALCLAGAPGPAGETAAPQTGPAAGMASMTAPEAEAMSREIIPRVEEIRGLRFRKPVPVRVVDDAAARAYFQDRLAKFWPDAQLRAEQAAYIDLGLLPAGTDLKQSLFDLLEEQAAGYYDPESDTFFVLGDMPRSSAPLFMAHELTHALDDQHHGIDAMIEKTDGDPERGMGVSCVVEGSGMLVMTVYLSQEILAGRLKPDVLSELAASEAGRAEVLKASPPLMQRALLSPYMLGMTFVMRGDLSRLMSGVQGADLDRLFKDPPVSSEQILHPEKYWDETKKDPPRPVALPDLCGRLGEGWARTGEGELGEMNLALLAGSTGLDPLSAEAALPGSWTNVAASGWGGDRWHLCSDRASGRRSTILATLWDTAEDAAQFEAALTPLAPPLQRLVSRRNDALVLVTGDAAGRAEGIARAALDAIAPPAPAGSER